MSRERRRLFGNLRAPGVPPELRERALTAARSAAEADRPAGTRRVTLTDRLWTSRPLRLAWAMAVVALVGINLWLDAGSAGSSSVGSHEALVARVGDRAPDDRSRSLLSSRGVVLQALFGEEAGATEKTPARRSARRAS